MLQLPEFPDVLSSQRTQGSVYMRFEDVAQDGSLKVGGMPHAIGLVSLGKVWFRTPISAHTRPLGIVPILTRLSMQTLGGPISVRNPLLADGSFQLAHTRDAERNVTRIMLNTYVDLHAPIAQTHGPQPANAGKPTFAGRAFAEHVFTRPWNPPGDRKVIALPSADGLMVPGPTQAFRQPIETLNVGEPTRWLDSELRFDPTPLTFGLTHTDANQHVNSLVYPSLFEDAALRRLMDLDYDTRALLVDFVDIAFRKPCFAGQRMYIWLRPFEKQGKLGAIGYLGPSECTPERAHCMCALTFRDREL